MKKYIANDYTGDDSTTDESAAFTENAFDLLNAVTYLMYRSVDRCRSGLIRRWFGNSFVRLNLDPGNRAVSRQAYGPHF